MSRLPTPGSDENTWGELLNEFLNIEHNADGTHKALVNPDATTASKGRLKLAGDLAGTADLPVVVTSNGAPIPTTAGVQTFTNKRITKRIATLTDAATVIPDIDNFDGGKLNSVSQTTQIANPTGAATEFQQYMLRIKSASVQSLSWGNAYRSTSTLVLPSATAGNGITEYLGFVWNADDGVFDLVAVA